MASRRRAEAPKSRRRFIPAIAVGTTLALLGGLAVFAQGYDAQEVLPLETSVWVARESGQYARVNTELAEIDTVRQVEEPSGVAQAGARSVVFGQGFRQLWPVDAANPIDLETGGVASAATATDTDAVDADDAATGEDDVADSGPQNTPLGTRQVVSAGEYLAYLTATGSVFVSGFSAPDGGAPVAFPVNPFATVVADEGEEPPTYAASAVAVSPTGTVVSYSPDESAVRRFDTESSDFTGDAVDVTRPPAADAQLEMALVGETWVLSAPADGLVWIEGVDEPVKTGLGGDARLQSSSATGTDVYLADTRSLVSIDLRTGEVSTRSESSGSPAAPVVIGDVVYAAWLSTAGGTMWSSEADATTDLELDGTALDQVQTITPVLQGNGQRAVLVEQESGMLWTVPDGRLVPLSQWDVAEDDKKAGTIKVDDVAQQEPPVAVADSFGVRAGQLVSLPLLLNDHDPNKKDVLSIVPGSMTGLTDTTFGELGLVSNNQAASVRVRAASGSTTFSYSVTDGSAASSLASVTLTVVADDTNSAPVWCGVEACQQDWPSPQLAPGGTVTVPVLASWVDPEGDTLVLSDARKNTVTDPVSVVPTADGRVAIRHNDPNAADSTIAITVVVSDSRGATAEKELLVRVSSSPPLVAAPVTLVAGVGEKTAIEIGDHVTGGSGAYTIVDAVETASTASGLVVTPNAAAGTVELSAPAVGEYLVNYTVQDSTTLAEQSAVLRLTAVGADAPIAIAPLTAIVRANEDTTVDVLGAVQNTTGRVLVITSASSSTPALSVSVVGQSRVRVSGTTATGEPGPVGTATITISDGNNATIEGQVTVFLVPPTTATSPIAVPDSVSVRAGAQVDIPVLENDLSPRGERLLMHPEVEGSGAAGELAFAGETTVRYLAPTEAGVYTLRYTTYLEGRPDRIDTAAVTVTVIAAGANRAPQPRVLSARAIAGQTVQIPVDMYGVDPDGDTVVLADVELPAAGLGVSSVSADGASVMYAAPANGVSGGQVSFAYTVRDAQGETGVGVVRVGVVSSELADATPITYSDYIRVRRGSSTPVVVQPMLDDRDPTQGTLELVSVVPNAPSGAENSEYARLLGLIDSKTSLPDGIVSLDAGSVVGTQSYVYTVQSTKSSSTSQGLIVVDVTDGEAPDAPIVADTVITARDRARLAKGIDVVSGKVQWATGSVSDLELSVWGSAADSFSVSGSKISGEAPADGALVPFTLTGEDSGGDKVEAHGFLRIPAFDDMRIQVRGAVDAVRVDEEKSVEFEVRKLLDLDASAVVEIRSDSGFIVQRGNASCAAASTGKALYKAGREAPWTDTCTVPVRLYGQSSWTFISVPIEINPKNPRPILGSISRTIAPGTTESLDLYANATTWEGGREGDRSQLDYSTVFSGSSFIVTQSGDSMTIEARADARSGTREAVQVSISSFGGMSSTVTLIVGVAPVDAPRGATFTQQCNAGATPSCAVTVVGLPGEYDPFAGKPGAGLSLVKLGTGATVSCTVATVAISSATQVIASWPAGRPAGGLCPVPFTVQDAQGRTGTGLLTLDVLSFPQAPLNVTTVAYTGTSVTLSVPLGDAGLAHPSVTGVSVYEGGVLAPNAGCTRGGPGSFSCVVSGLVNGERHVYTVRAVNSVGESTDTTPVESWAYRAPVVADLTATSVYDPARTAPNAGVVNVTITAADDAVLFKVLATNQTYPRTGDVTEISFTLPPGTHPIDVIPVSQFQPPIGAANRDGAARSVSVTAVGSPSYPNSGSAVGTANSITLNDSIFERNSSTIADEKYVAWRVSEGEPSCVMVGATVQVNGGISSTSRTITVPTEENYFIKACGTNAYGVATSQPRFADSYPTPTAPSGDLTYTVGTTPAATAPSVREYTLEKAPAPAAKRKYDIVYTRGSATSTNQFSTLTLDSAPGISVAYCRDRFGVGYTCDLSSPVNPTGAPTIVRVDFPTTCSTVATWRDTNLGWVSQAARGNATIEAERSEDGQTVKYTVTFTGNFRSLKPAVSDPICISDAPPPPPKP